MHTPSNDASEPDAAQPVQKAKTTDVIATVESKPKPEPAMSRPPQWISLNSAGILPSGRKVLNCGMTTNAFFTAQRSYDDLSIERDIKVAPSGPHAMSIWSL